MVQTVSGLLDGVVFTVDAADIIILQQHVTQSEDRCNALCVLLNVPLQLLSTDVLVLKGLKYMVPENTKLGVKKHCCCGWNNRIIIYLILPSNGIQ